MRQMLRRRTTGRIEDHINVLVHPMVGCTIVFGERFVSLANACTEHDADYRALLKVPDVAISGVVQTAFESHDANY